MRDEIWNGFAQSLFYHQSEFHDESGYKRLAERLDKIDKERGTRGNRLFYLAVAPGAIRNHHEESEGSRVEQSAGRRLGAGRLWKNRSGRDLDSARELNRIVRHAFSEDQTYRIDHFLGKETAQNILVLRFANAIFEPIWNTRYIDHVQITAAETLGVEGRAGYYEGAGALRDMVQNHLLQLLCLVAMEPPTDLGADSIRDEKVKIVRSLRRFTREEVGTDVVRGAIRRGRDQRKSRSPAYREEKSVESEVARPRHSSRCACASITGAGRTCRFTSASANGCRNPAPKSPSISKRRRTVLFNKESDALDQNVLVIRIQPDEGISLRMQAKVPGHQFPDRAGEDGFPLRNIFRQGEPGSLRAAAARCDERRRHAFRAARRSGAGVGVHRSDRRSLGARRSTRRNLFIIPPARGARKRPTNCSRATGARGGDCRAMRCARPKTRHDAGIPVEIGTIESRAEKTLGAERRRR